MFDLLTSEQGLMSRRIIAVGVQQTGCRVPSCRFPEAKGIFIDRFSQILLLTLPRQVTAVPTAACYMLQGCSYPPVFCILGAL